MLIRLAYPKGKKRRSKAWFVHSFRQLLAHWTVQWTVQHAALHATMPSLIDLPHPRHLLSCSYSQLSEDYMKQQRLYIKRTLQGTLRQTMQRQSNFQHRRILDVANSRQLGTVIKLLTACPTSHCDLTTLHCPTEGQITDHFRIHSKVTEFFSDWYQAPPDMDPSAIALNTIPDWWRQLLQAPQNSNDQPSTRTRPFPLIFSVVCEKSAL